MKTCPSCGRSVDNAALNFCPHDGARLTPAAPAPSQIPAPPPAPDSFKTIAHINQPPRTPPPPQANPYPPNNFQAPPTPPQSWSQPSAPTPPPHWQQQHWQQQRPPQWQQPHAPPQPPQQWQQPRAPQPPYAPQRPFAPQPFKPPAPQRSAGRTVGGVVLLIIGIMGALLGVVALAGGARNRGGGLGIIVTSLSLTALGLGLLARK